MASGQFTSVQASITRLLTQGTLTGASESQLLDRFLTMRDEGAFEAIVNRHGPMVLGVCRRVLSDPNDVDDAFQATFLVLVKKAGSIRDRSLLGTWLYGVARRVAIRARVNAGRLRSREQQGLEMVAWQEPRASGDDLAELRAILDQEVGRLTERYRSPLVLCDLEGCTHEQAAAQPRCPVGTIKSRLARARDKLRSQLARRGLLRSAGLLAAAVAPEPASAVTTELMGSTVEAATRLAAGRTISAGAVSAAVAALVQGTIRSMSMSTIKVGAVLLAAASVVATGAGVLAYQPGTKGNSDVAQKNHAKTVIGSAKGNAAQDETEEIASLAQARLRAAETVLEGTRRIYKDGHVGALYTPEVVRFRALGVLEAERDVNPDKEHRIAALESYLKLMTALVEEEKSRNHKDELPVAEYYRLEAEFWLAQARAGKEPRLPGSGSGSRQGTEKSIRPGTDPKSQALLARLEETIPMKFPEPTPLEEVLKYLHAATAGRGGEAIPIYVDPVAPGTGESMSDQLMKTPITMDLEGVPLRRSLKLLAEQLGMGYGIKDGMVTIRPPDMLRRNWHELMVMEESFPESSPLAIEVERARRGELTSSEMNQLEERLRGIEEVAKRYASIRMMRGAPVNQPGGMMPGRPTSSGPGGRNQ
jgi:RNA polymerase sigma factor (sigma-70 family)